MDSAKVSRASPRGGERCCHDGDPGVPESPPAEPSMLSAEPVA